jgi:cytochrome c-type biogenesis protein
VNIESFASQLADGSLGALPAFAVAFAGGMVAGFGPCVLPMLPAVFGYVTGQVAETPGIPGRTTWLRGLALAATFVLGMSLFFASIGALAAILGRALLAGAWAHYIVAAICLVLGLQMVGVIDLPFDALNRFVPNTHPERRGFVGAFLFGILFAVVASPCSTPILAAIATIAATRGSVPQGAALLFAYGLGKGVPLMLLGLAAGSLAVMRSISRATGVLTKVGGVALIGAAAYLVWLA